VKPPRRTGINDPGYMLTSRPGENRCDREKEDRNGGDTTGRGEHHDVQDGDDRGIGGARRQNKRCRQQENADRDGLGDDKSEDLAATPRAVVIWQVSFQS
jgi:hypothetical protein